MARAKPKWRKVLNSRFLRWWLLGHLVALIPGLGRVLAFFPKRIDMIDGADRILENHFASIDPAELEPHMDFLRTCMPHDSRDPDVVLPDGVETGRRTCLYGMPWVDMTNGSVLLPDRQRTVVARGTVANWNGTSARLFRRRVAVDGRVFVPLITRNYFHVLTENALRLLDLLEAGNVDDRDLIIALPPGRTAVEEAFYRGLLTLYGTVRVQTYPTTWLLKPTEAVIHFPRDNYWEWPPITPELARLLGTVFDVVYGRGAMAKGPPRLYLSRDGAKLRDPVNSGRLSIALGAAGFEHFVANDSNHPVQIARFRAARTVVAVHGAGLTNLLFCQPGTKVVEIFPGNFVKSTYWNLARQLDLDYRPVISGPGNYDQRFDADVDGVLDALESF